MHKEQKVSVPPESDTRGEVPDRQRSKLDPLVLLIARIKSIHGNVSDALSQQRILHELGRLLKLAYSIEASVLSELSALREENERLTGIVKTGTFYPAYESLKAELATLRASASSEGWIEINPATKLTDQMEVGRFMGRKWVITRLESPADGWSLIVPNDFYTHYRMLNPPTRPTATNPEKATSDRSQG